LQTTTWYYPWDCASGCIWNIKVIKGLDLVEENAEIEPEQPFWGKCAVYGDMVFEVKND
jgi:hypothetical protein